jgi:TRAP-type C4-dicarboxylate transport system permease small subunit
MLQFSVRALGYLVALVASALRASLVAAMGVMLACIAIQVVMRYVFGKAPSWSEELALLMFSWATLGGLAMGVREGFHVRLDVLINLLPAPLRRWAETLIEAVTAAFGAYLAWSGMRFLDATGGSVSAAIGYPIEFLHALAPVAGALICLFALWRIVAGPEPEPGPEPVPELAPCARA